MRSVLLLIPLKDTRNLNHRPNFTQTTITKLGFEIMWFSSKAQTLYTPREMLHIKLRIKVTKENLALNIII